MERRIAYFLGMSILAARMILSQPAAKPLEFEVASIRPSEPAAPNTKRASLEFGAAESVTATYTTLRSLITTAYNVRDLQISGAPDWISTERYDIVAKADRADIAASSTDPNATDEQRKASDDRTRERIRSLLADRFGLVVHRETKEQPVYLLTVSKSGSKLQEATTPAARHETRGGRGRSQGFAAKVEWLAQIISNVTGRPVLDKTGLTGNYDWLLEWTPDQPGSIQTDSSPPSIFTALQEQLGLRLESGKAPVELLVVDHVNHPSAN